MGLMKGLRRTTLPSVPPHVEEHPAFAKHTRQLAEITATLAATRADIDAIEQERTQISAAVSEDSVLELLAEDPAAGERLAASKRRLTDIDERLTHARERAVVQAAAVARVEARTAGIRQGVVAEIRQEVECAYLTLNEQLAEHFAALAPVNARLLELQRQHGALITDAIWWSELHPREGGNGVLPSKMALWRAHARSLGINGPV